MWANWPDSSAWYVRHLANTLKPLVYINSDSACATCWSTHLNPSITCLPLNDERALPLAPFSCLQGLKYSCCRNLLQWGTFPVFPGQRWHSMPRVFHWATFSSRSEKLQVQLGSLLRQFLPYSWTITAVSGSTLPRQRRIAFTSPFMSHSRTPKKHSLCHRTALTKQEYHNGHCYTDLTAVHSPLGYIKQITMNL